MKSTITELRRGLSWLMYGLLSLPLLLSPFFAEANQASNIGEVKISIQLTNATVAESFQQIEKKTSFTFNYVEEDINQHIRLSKTYQDATVKVILSDIGTTAGLVFKQVGNNIYVSREAEKAKIDERIIRGTVVDQNGKPVIGATVSIPGTTIGTITNIDGAFALGISDDVAFLGDLKVTFVGYESATVRVGDNNTVEVILQESTLTMEEVVVTGYQEVDRRKMTGSVVTLKTDEIKQDALPSVDQMIQGKVSGVSVINTSGAPGATPKIRIRGTSSLSGIQEPLWVVDGVILEDPVRVNPNLINEPNALISSGIGGLNPEDIESITVLKDASSTAIYGTRAANGVIVVTTKKGKGGTMRLNYSGNVTVSQKPSYNRYNVMNSKERMQLNKDLIDGGFNLGLGQPGIQPYKMGDFEKALMDYYAGNLNKQELDAEMATLETVNTDWFDILFRNAVSQRHNVSLSGGNDKSTYYMSLGYMDQQGDAIGSGMKRYTGTVNLKHHLNDRVTLGTNLAYSKRDVESFFTGLFGIGNPLQYALGTPRNQRAFNEDGSYHYYTNYFGDFHYLDELEKGWNTSEVEDLRAQLSLNIRLLDNLELHTIVSAQRSATKSEMGTVEESAYVRYMKDQYTPRGANESYWKSGGYLDASAIDGSNYMLRNSLTYRPSIGNDHSFDIMLGNEMRSFTSVRTATKVYGYTSEPTKIQIPQNELLSYLGQPYWSYNESFNNFLSWYATAAYTFREKYTVNANARIDGSNRFGANTKAKFKPLWSAGFNWQIHKEAALDNLDWLNSLVLRGSYGVQGNISEFAVSDLVTSVGDYDQYIGEVPLVIRNAPNPDLRWEQTYSSNLAMDFVLFNNVSGSLEYYARKSTDLIAPRAVSGVSGFQNMEVNWADMANRGLELTLNFSPLRTNDFEWNMNFTAGINKNEVLKVNTIPTWNDLSSMAKTRSSSAVEGKPLGALYSFRFAEIGNDGIAYFYNEDDSLVYGGIADTDAMKYEGSVYPVFTGGITNTIKYKNFTLSALFTYGGGNVLRMNSLGSYWITPRLTDQLSKEFINRWKQEGDESNTSMPAILHPSSPEWSSLYSGSSPYNEALYNDSDIRVVKGDYLRLQNITLTYDVPSKLTQKLGMQSMKLNIQGQNLYLWADKRLYGIDPESASFQTNTSNYNTSYIGTDTSLPIPRTVTAGVNVTF
ncbi:SusC/RagA family TonB-linked outer membrane protein [Limibacter armeniacum]|uniref:SusC/RagA family TonB-linked outer membrane protein n=1 Tax=Limibacter armeniacum TaxID=466084 RepID=UPI002FE66790